MKLLPQNEDRGTFGSPRCIEREKASSEGPQLKGSSKAGRVDVLVIPKRRGKKKKSLFLRNESLPSHFVIEGKTMPGLPWGEKERSTWSGGTKGGEETEGG